MAFYWWYCLRRPGLGLRVRRSRHQRGAALDHDPNPVYITLVPVGSEGESTNITKPEPPVMKPKTVPVS
ncbi:hypothetical protein [Stappia sp. WLB 29]|uniref:hypothetical protein n=1 Tax=Stappia sp. WLB 29 TaxID=2925220 RepID=UPI0020C04660|nr:hypothetical protein [Stappia sp. WLB 29]